MRGDPHNDSNITVGNDTGDMTTGDLGRLTMSDGVGMSPELKRRVFEAVQSELVELGVDRFSLEGVARRSGVDSSESLRQWRDRRVLLMEVMLARTSAAAWRSWRRATPSSRRASTPWRRQPSSQATR